MRKYIILLLILMAAFGCYKQDEMITPSELGLKSTSGEVACVAGKLAIEVLCDGEFTASLPSGASWIRFSEGKSSVFKGRNDMLVELEYDINRGTQRSVVVEFSSYAGKQVSYELTQAGVLSSGISFSSRNVTFDASAAEHSVRLVTILKDASLNFDVAYEGAAGWLDNVRKSNNFIVFSLAENTSNKRRTAIITVSDKDNPEDSDVLYVTQEYESVALTELTVAQLKTYAEIGVKQLPEHLLLKNVIVISDNSEGNGAPNKNISPSLQDLTLASRTIYVQDPDGKAGIKIIFDSAEDNTTRRYDTISLLLDGVSIENILNPNRYTLTGLTIANIYFTETGSSQNVVAKKKRISELNDMDVNTFVTLTDCEIPIRKGPYVPIDERHSYLINRYPMPVLDFEGSSLYLVTNRNAAWHRDGLGLPQGKGSISGIIVHETFDNFAWSTDEQMKQEQQGLMTDYVTEIGNIGRYQIRPIRKEEIEISSDLSDAFSELLMEVRYFNKDYPNMVINAEGNNSIGVTIHSTYPAVEFPLADGAVNGILQAVSDNSPKGIAAYRDWTILGPYIDGKITDPTLSNGVFDYFGNTNHWKVHSNSPIAGLILEPNGSSWYCSLWTPQKYWLATVSTKDLTAANLPLSVQFGAISGLGDAVGGPRYWCIEYSINGLDWFQFGEYSVPDFPILAQRKMWQCPGPKYCSFTLPNDAGILGRDNFYVRLRPTSNKAGTTDSYDSGEVVSNMPSQLNYFAIRYNK